MAPGYPSPGCVVEYLEDNSCRMAIVLEESGGKARLLLPGRKETGMPVSRLLPWLGPVYPAASSKEEMIRILEKHRLAREEKARTADVIALWEMAQGEVAVAAAPWFAELAEACPDADTIAAYGRALLACKTHFRFQPPDFVIYDQETVEKRLRELRQKHEKEALASQGTAFMRLLWDVACRKKTLPPPDAGIYPPEALAARIRKLLYARVLNPDSQEDEALWRMLSKGIAEAPHLPLQLLMAWGALPPHYNFWLDRADYERGDAWWHGFAEEVHALEATAAGAAGLDSLPLPFISIDGPATVDIDDAFYIEQNGDGWRLVMAFACPALAWPFGSQLDKAVSRRATSIYLPEGDMHMLPEALGTKAYSLLANCRRPALCMDIALDSSGEAMSCRLEIANVTLAANLRYADVQAALNGSETANPAQGWADQLRLAHNLAQKREALRISKGAVVMQRQEPELKLAQGPDDILVELVPETPAGDAQRLVSEMMILASACFADWAAAKGIPLIYRTQNVALPKEYAGVWSRPEDLSRIMRALIPSSLETEPKPHAALGLERYAQVTSPLRRYPDLVNEAQIVSCLQTGAPRFNAAELAELLDSITPALDAAGAAQRFRPRYWKLLYFRQQGDRVWRDGVITEENENFVNVALPVENIYVRGRRQIFDERASPGMNVRVRLGKVNPLANEIQILETASEEF